MVLDDTPEFALLYASLFKTDIYYSLAKRQGRSLLAQKKVSQYFSAALDTNPWVAEVENWVRTSLARTSINAWSVASGEDSVHAGSGGFIEITKKYGNLCGRYKYNAQGYQSLRFIALMLVVSSLPFILLLSCEWRPIERRFSKLLHNTKTLVQGILREIKGRVKPARQSGDNNNNNSATSGSISNSDGPPAPAISPEGVSAQDESTAAEAESSTAAAVRQHESTEAPITRNTSSGGSRARDPEVPEDDRIEWEPLVFHKLPYPLKSVVLVILLLFWWLAVSIWWTCCRVRALIGWTSTWGRANAPA
ncbi:hypothetical protein GQ44DRAFT_718620 [Phaeosphaeriaceae sp. PMI808]|nr:hypothetical protein GQ44DRAFT_718620 [Phaeosphaeriaceae sp. PMI808]